MRFVVIYLILALVIYVRGICPVVHDRRKRLWCLLAVLPGAFFPSVTRFIGGSMVAPDLPTSEAGSSDMINDLYDICIDKGYAFYGVVSADSVAISNWVDQTGAAYPFVQTDRETAEAMMRSNPGVLLMKDGTILGKWGHNDLGHLVQLLEQQKESQIERFVQSEKAEGLPYLLVRAILWYIIPLLLIIGIDRIWISSKFYKHYIYKQRFNTNKNEKENRSR